MGSTETPKFEPSTNRVSTKPSSRPSPLPHMHPSIISFGPPSLVDPSSASPIVNRSSTSPILTVRQPSAAYTHRSRSWVRNLTSPIVVDLLRSTSPILVDQSSTSSIITVHRSSTAYTHRGRLWLNTLSSPIVAGPLLPHTCRSFVHLSPILVNLSSTSPILAVRQSTTDSPPHKDAYPFIRPPTRGRSSLLPHRGRLWFLPLHRHSSLIHWVYICLI